MKSRKSQDLISRLWKFTIANWFLAIFLICIAFVGLILLSRIFARPEQLIYAKVKVSQGLWWANTSRPPIWLAKAFQKGDIERNLTGEPIVEILSARYYPWWTEGQYDVYLTLRLKVTDNQKTKTHSFKRSTISVGSPIELIFPS